MDAADVLSVLSLAVTPLRSLPDFPRGQLEKLELDIDLAVMACHQLSLMTSSQELRLLGNYLHDEKIKATVEQLARLWCILARMRSLREVWMCRQAATALKGESQTVPPPAWQRQLGSVRLIVGGPPDRESYYIYRGAYDSRGFHHEFATAWDSVE
ncbi:hypothetical protein N2152v2_002855 [Parachlorella kessleri]